MKVISCIVLIFLLQVCYAPPVTQNKKEEEDSKVTGLEDYMEYHRYLKEVVNALESDTNFKKKLEQAGEEEIKSGKIADELEFVSHHVRNRLDEIKRVELDRLKQLTEKKRALERDGGNSIDDDPSHHHLDHNNPHTFEIEDLKKLIAKTTQDLEEADKKRQQEFKQYELEKEYQKEIKLNHTNGEEREKLEKEMKELEDKHKKHEPLHQPGHKAQLEEVWEEQDQMQQDFDPKTFFMLHDIDGNGLWDQDEVKALFIKELDKMYQQGAPEDDMRERVEEMERMRESVFHEMDRNRDGFIDYEEFLAETKSKDFAEDNGWQSIDQQRPYTDEELAEYIRMHEANQIPQGYPYQQVHPGAYQQVPPSGYPQAGFQHQQGYQQGPQPGFHPNPGAQQQFHPGQVPQNPPQQLPNNYVPPLNTNEVYHNQPNYHPQAPPQHHQQIPQHYQNQQVQYQQVPQGQPQQVHPVPQQQAQQPQYQAQQVYQQQGQPQGQQIVSQGQPQVPQGQQPVPQGQPNVPQGQQPIVQGQQPQVPQVQQPQVPQVQQPQVPQVQQQIPQGQQPIVQGQQQQTPQVQQPMPQGQPQVQQVQPQQH